MFFDHAKIHVAAGNGGNGCVSFRREMHVPKGGPDGGDGGRGGDVYLVGDAQLRDLQVFTYKVHFKAGHGGAGQGARKHGADGEDVIIPVPLGTQVWTVAADAESKTADDLAEAGARERSGDTGAGASESVISAAELIADIVRPGQRVPVAKSGGGGHGNARFVNSVRQTPRFAELGEPGEAQWIRLSLKLIADAGLAGLPNAGKSSLLRRLSNAKPKVADYPFTTVEPMLGVVDWSGEGDVFALADVPGLLEGASEGIGLGHEFLAHLERCRMLLHVVDATGYYEVEPLQGFRTILHELGAHANILAEKPQVVVLNKIDAMPASAIEEQRALFVGEVERLRKEGHPAFTYLVDEEEPAAEQLVWPVSAATGAGLPALVHWVGPLLRELCPPEEPEAAESERAPGATDVVVEVSGEPGGHVTYRPRASSRRGFTVGRDENGWVVRGEVVRKLVSRFDLDNEEAIRYLAERLDRLGVYSALRAKGAQPGDDVDMEGYAFEFQ
jgi:GTP-binding protein